VEHWRLAGVREHCGPSPRKSVGTRPPGMPGEACYWGLMDIPDRCPDGEWLTLLGCVPASPGPTPRMRRSTLARRAIMRRCQAWALACLAPLAPQRPRRPRAAALRARRASTRTPPPCRTASRAPKASPQAMPALRSAPSAPRAPTRTSSAQCVQDLQRHEDHLQHRLRKRGRLRLWQGHLPGSAKRLRLCDLPRGLNTDEIAAPSADYCLRELGTFLRKGASACVPCPLTMARPRGSSEAHYQHLGAESRTALQQSPKLPQRFWSAPDDPPAALECESEAR